LCRNNENIHMPPVEFKPMIPNLKQLNMDLKHCSHCDWTTYPDKRKTINLRLN